MTLPPLTAEDLIPPVISIPAVTMMRYMPTSALVADPHLIQYAVESYFAVRRSSFLVDASKDAPSPPLPLPTPTGLAMAVGFSSFKKMLSAIESPDTSKEASHYLMLGCSRLVDLYTEGGLTSKLDKSFTKFIMSAQFDITEKKEQRVVSDTDIKITWVSPHDGSPLSQDPKDYVASLPEADIIEMERLESALPRSMRLPEPQTDPDQAHAIEDLF